jgi:hypothetical protein
MAAMRVSVSRFGKFAIAATLVAPVWGWAVIVPQLPRLSCPRAVSNDFTDT